MFVCPYRHQWCPEYIGTELVSEGYKYKNTEEEESKAIPLSEHHFVTITFEYLQSRLVLSVKNDQNHLSL